MNGHAPAQSTAPPRAPTAHGPRGRPARRRLSPTLAGYLARHFAARFLVLLGGVLGVILLVTAVEMLDQVANKPDTGLGTAVHMAALKLPRLAEEVMAFVVMFAAMASFWHLTRTQELVVARGAGVSAWQFLLPVVAVTVIVGLGTVTILNPVGSVLLRRFDTLAAEVDRGEATALAAVEGGLWLRQATGAGAAVIHARRLDRAEMTLRDVTIFRYTDADTFASRIDTARAVLKNGHWELHDARHARPGQPTANIARMRMETTLTPRRIENSFARPETISFWDLPGFIARMERAGFAAEAQKLQYHRLLSLPILLVAMVTLAANFSLRAPRRGGVLLLIGAGVAAGFAVHVLSNLVFALGLGGHLPVVLAAWSPAVVALSLGLSALLYLEDG